MSRAGGQGPIVLVVNAAAWMQRVLCDRIAAAYPDLDLRRALSADDALLIVEQEHIDIVIIADDSAATGLKQIRAMLERSPHSSIIVVSSVTDSEAPTDKMSAGAITFVSTQAPSGALTAQLAKLLYPSVTH